MFKRFISILAATSLFGCVAAQAQQPVQWDYSFQSGVATATYPGNVVIDGTTYDASIVQTVANIAELRLNGATGWTGATFVKGYFSTGDAGAGTFVYVSSDTTSADNGGTIIVDAAGRRWYRVRPNGVYMPEQFGAVCDNTAGPQAANVTAFNAMFAAANTEAPSGARVVIGASGQCLLNGTVTIPGPVIVEGPTGQVQSGGTAYASVVVNVATGDIFNVTTSQAVTFRNFGMRNSITRTAGSYIKITGDGVQQPIGMNFTNLAMNGCFSCIAISNGKHWTVTNSVFVNWGNAGSGNAISFPSTNNPDSGDNHIIGNNFISGTTGAGAGSGYASVYLESTFAVNIIGNKFFGGEFGVEANVKDVSGNLIISANSFEQQRQSAIDVRQAVASVGSIGNLIIDSNEISVLDSVSTPVTPSAPTIFVQQGLAATYVSNVVISNNAFNNKFAANLSAIYLADGIGAVVQGNVINTNGEALPAGIQTGGYADNVRLLDNVFVMTTTAKRYGNGLNANTLVRDSGLALTDLGAWANGSQVFTTDGAPASSPCTATSTGSNAMRQNGAWKCF